MKVTRKKYLSSSHNPIHRSIDDEAAAELLDHALHAALSSKGALVGNGTLVGKGTLVGVSLMERGSANCVLGLKFCRDGAAGGWGEEGDG